MKRKQPRRWEVDEEPHMAIYAGLRKRETIEPYLHNAVDYAEKLARANPGGEPGRLREKEEVYR